MHMTAYTPTPWRVFATTDGRKLVGIGAQDGGGILDAGFGVWAWNDAEGIANAELVVRAVNAHDEMLAALRNVQKLISEAAMTGFNWKDGDWADRLFFSQQMTSAAIAKATDKLV